MQPPKAANPPVFVPKPPAAAGVRKHVTAVAQGRNSALILRKPSTAPPIYRPAVSPGFAAPTIAKHGSHPHPASDSTLQRKVIQCRWEQNAPPPQPDCDHGDGTETFELVRIPSYPHQCPHHAFQPGAAIQDGRCTHCHQVVPSNGTRIVRNGGTMQFDGFFPGSGMNSNIYKCVICGARYSNAPGFGAQEDSAFCGTAGNQWR